MFDLEYNKKYTVDMPGNSDEILPDVQRMLIERIEFDLDIQEDLGFPNDWEWQWVQTRGTYAGKLTKRLRNLLLREYEVSVPDDYIEDWGNMVKSHQINRKFVFDIDLEVDWKAGQFGDEGSCFFGGSALNYSWHRRMWVEKLGTEAIRFYDPENPDRGVGRALAVPIQSPTIGEETWAFFNAYGVGNFETARVLSELLNNFYHRVSMKAFFHSVDLEFSQDPTPLYMNTHKGYLVSNSDIQNKSNKFRRIEFNYYENEEECTCELS